MAKRNKLALSVWGLWLGLACGAQADLAVITSQAAGQLTFMDTQTGQILQQTKVQGQPAAVALGAGYVATLSVATKKLHLFDTEGKPLATRLFDGAPFGVAIQDGGSLWITDAAGQGWLHQLTLPDLRLRRSLVAAANPTGLDANAQGWVVVAARDADLALIWPPDCGACKALQVPVGHHPFGVTLQGDRAFVTNVLSNDVSVIDLPSAREIARIPTGSRPYAVTFAGDRGFVSNQYDASLTVFDTQTLKPLAEVPTADYPEGLSVTSDGKIVVAAWFADLVQIFDAQTLRLEHELAMPEGPRAFGRFTAPR